MSYSVNTDSFPSPRSYADARAHFDSTKPYRDESDQAPRPIGVRAHRNKQMRLLDDESVAFRLYRTDCVIYHPDGQVTIEGYSSMSTTAFVNCLGPSNVRHGQGSWRVGGAVLELWKGYESYWLPYDRSDPLSLMQRNPDYGKGTLVINCGSPVRLNYCDGRWLPVDVADLHPFEVPTIDRSLALKVSREYHLLEFEAWLRMILVCAGELALPPADAEGSAEDVLDQLIDGNFINAAKLIPRGEKETYSSWHRPAFNRAPVSADAPRPGFIRSIRQTLYEREGVITMRQEPMISRGCYERLKRSR